MRCCGCLLLALLAWPLLFVIVGLLGGRPDDEHEDEEKAAIVTILMD